MGYYKVTLAHAVCSELGKKNGGKPGDQTQNTDNTKGELRFQDWYVSGDSWDCVLRCKDKALRTPIAQNAISAVRNRHIGYSQEHRYTLYDKSKPFFFDASKVTTDVECDCSSLATVCARYAGITIPKETYTGDMEKVYTKYGFKSYSSKRYVLSSDKLVVGDILVRAGAHTAIVANTLYHMTRELYNVKGSMQVGGDVAALQYRLNEIIGAGLKVDGELGPKSAQAIRDFQVFAMLSPDGIAGRDTLTAAGFLYH